MSERYTVRVTRPDGSVTFKCNSVSRDRAEGERIAWLGVGYEAEVLTEAESAAEQRAWLRAVKGGGTYFPPIT